MSLFARRAVPSAGLVAAAARYVLAATSGLSLWRWRVRRPITGAATAMRRVIPPVPS
ncbi:hypothetical protein [Asticcacaulis sp.]|uniref:hypothetical protein n=1 Tax=Asticcacaulis sp. TaxID=1872648 RepID=UPI003918BDE8